MSPESDEIMTKKIQLEDAVGRYLYSGILQKCRDNGFGYVDNYFVHISSCRIRQESMCHLEGQPIAYALGGNPYSYKRNREDWKSSVVEWIPLENISGFSSSDHYLKYAVSIDDYWFNLTLKRAVVFLGAKWYIRLWNTIAKCNPQSGLCLLPGVKPDIKELVLSRKDFISLNDLLIDISRSYWFREEEPLANPFSALGISFEEFHKDILWIQTTGRTVQGLNEPFWSAHLDKIINNSLLRNAVALDIEANEQEIFQVACCWVNGSAEDRENEGLSHERIQSVLDRASQQIPGACWVGHNLLEWDLRRLREMEVELPEDAPVWDTLLMGWLIEPWKSSHALVVGEGAHQAVFDAFATLEIFKEQTLRLAPFIQGIVCNMHWVLDALLNSLTEGHSGLSMEDGPRAPDHLGDKVLLISRADLGGYLWRPRVRLEDPDGRLNTRDPVLQPGLCIALAKETNDLQLSLMAVVVQHAWNHAVEVRLSMIPSFIMDEGARKVVHDLHMGVKPSTDLDQSIRVCLADEMDWHDFLQRLPQSHVPRPLELLVLMIAKTSKELTTQQLERLKGGSPPSPSTSTLFFRHNGTLVEGLRFDPPGLGAPGTLWHSLPPLSSSFPAELPTHGVAANVQTRAWIPRWREGSLLQLDSDWIFISPDTTNRRLYLQDLLLRILNIVHGENCGDLWILTMRHRGEADWMRQKLVLLGLSVDHSDSPLRQLENLKKSGRKVLVITQETLGKHFQGAEQLDLRCHVLVEEVPLLDWVYLTHAPEHKDDDAGNTQPGEWTRVHLTERMVRQAAKIFLPGWLAWLCRDWPKTIVATGLLDPRLPVRGSGNVEIRDVAYHGEEVLGSGAEAELYKEWCVAPSASEETTCTYEDLRKVLEENWKYDNFLPVQQPAIEAIATTRKDLLLRLPTGAGKSVVFQVPALWFGEKTRRLTVVISPLRALMKDQVANLNRRGLVDVVDYLSGGRDSLENRAVYQGMLDGRIRLVYTAPERFRLSRFTEILERRRALDGGLQFIVMDEAHCVSEWGFEFRPDYLFAANYIRKWFKPESGVGNPHHILAMSATVTEKNREDLERELGLGQGSGDGYHDLPESMPHPIQDFIVLNSVEAHAAEDPDHDEKLIWLIGRIQEFQLEKSGIVVFSRRRRDCHKVADILNEIANQPRSKIPGWVAAPFHAGMNEASKAEVLEGFRNKDIHVLICTKAFGMGMDIGHIHHCVHLSPPTFIEDYLQEVGRIGRDAGLRQDAGRIQVTADLLFSEEEINNQKELLEKNSVKPGFVRDLHDWILENMISPVEGCPPICLIPSNLQDTLKEAGNETKISQGVFWLERMEAIKVEGRYPPCMEFIINTDVLARWLKETSSDERALQLARFIQMELSLNQAIPVIEHGKSGTSSSSFYATVLKGLKAGLLSLFGKNVKQTTDQSAAATAIPETNEKTLSVPVQKILNDCDYSSIDDIYLSVMALKNDHVLSFDRIIMAERFQTPSGGGFETLLAHVIECFITETEDGVVSVPFDQVFEEQCQWQIEQIKSAMTEEQYSEQNAKISVQVHREVRRAIWSGVYLLNRAGYQIEERIGRNGENLIVRSVPAGGIPRASRQVLQWRRQSGDLSNAVQFDDGGEKGTISLVEALQIMVSPCPYTDLVHCITFLDKAGILQWSDMQEEWNSLVRVLRVNPLPAFEENWSPEESTEQTPATKSPQEQYRDMEERHVLRKIRGICMHLLCMLPQDTKKRFIDEYFSAKSKDELQSLLAQFAGELTTDASADIKELLVQARQERFAEEFDRLNENQKRVCAMDVRQNIMVNAGPGSGKTKVLTMRCAHLIHRQGIPPSGILVLAFNRAVVSEIKERVQSLFRELGYGGYARSLNVYTFHSFALQQLPDVDRYDDEGITEALERFATRMENDAYASSLASKFQAVLVDEFQDMTTDFYTVVSQLVRHCRGGGMVIGDDDQDILGWNRKEAPFEAYEYFTRFRDQFHPIEENLLINYRSAASIVDAANINIQKSSDKCGFQRVKMKPMSCNRDLPGHAKTHSILTPDEAHSRLLDILLGSYEHHETNAILCRTNKECFAILQLLKQQECLNKASVRVLGQTDYALFQLRETAVLLDVCHTYDAFQFVENHVWTEIMDKVRQEGLPDFDEQHQWYQLIYDTARREHGRLRCQNLVDFLMEMRSSDIARLEQRHRVSGKDAPREIIISTIHKVKGLEFDNVIVASSFSDFGRRRHYQNSVDLVGDEMARARGDEARLLYVGLTRAKNQLHLISDLRLKAWFNHGQAFHHDGVMGSSGFQGDPKEVFLSWSGRTEQVNAGLQEYIKNHIKAGDSIVFAGNEIQHTNRNVGVLSQAGNRLRHQIHNPRVQVGAVLRYRCGQHFMMHHPQFYNALDDSIKRQGWFYTITVQSC